MEFCLKNSRIILNSLTVRNIIFDNADNPRVRVSFNISITLFFIFAAYNSRFRFRRTLSTECIENSITNAYRRIVRIVRIHVFMKTRYAQYAAYSYTNFSFSIPIMKTI